MTPRDYQAPSAVVAAFYFFLMAWTCVSVLFLIARISRSEISDVLQVLMITGILCFTWYFSLGLFYRIRMEGDGTVFLAGVRKTAKVHPREIEAVEGPFLPLGFVRLKSKGEKHYLLCWVRDEDLLAILKRIGEINPGIDFKTR
ncbi:MAG: hypothetical protein MUC98_07240 [Desulfobacterota bacterium]|nr:hypothetical protein [Thermodesulfobacteriota bacterium]